MLTAWGQFVADRIVASLETKTADLGPIDCFLKLHPTPRVKSIDSFLAKSVRIGKSYASPLNDITDQVGVRFVVLLTAQIKVVCSAIESSSEWEFEISRDVDEEKRRKPNEFDYQSQHYLVRSKADLEINGFVIPKGTPCEIQVRTLLQHAFAELAHDTAYKPKTAISQELRREVAKSSALIETTDAIFTSVTQELAKADRRLSEIRSHLQSLYESSVGTKSSPEISPTEFVLDHFKDWAEVLEPSEIREFLNQQDFVSERIAECRSIDPFFEQSAVLAVYYWVSKFDSEIEREWPLDLKTLNRIFAHLGKTPDNLR